MSDWIEFDGDKCPVPSHTMVVVKLANGSVSAKPMAAGHWVWNVKPDASTIVAYRRVETETPPNSSALTQQEGGTHYKSLAIQPVEFIHRNKIGFCEGNAIKYLARWRNKNGVEDLKKARHYIDLLIEMEAER